MKYWSVVFCYCFGIDVGVVFCRITNSVCAEYTDIVVVAFFICRFPAINLPVYKT